MGYDLVVAQAHTSRRILCFVTKLSCCYLDILNNFICEVTFCKWSPWDSGAWMWAALGQWGVNLSSSAAGGKLSTHRFSPVGTIGNTEAKYCAWQRGVCIGMPQQAEMLSPPCGWARTGPGYRWQTPKQQQQQQRLWEVGVTPTPQAGTGILVREQLTLSPRILSLQYLHRY